MINHPESSDKGVPPLMEITIYDIVTGYFHHDLFHQGWNPAKEGLLALGPVVRLAAAGGQMKTWIVKSQNGSLNMLN